MMMKKMMRNFSAFLSALLLRGVDVVLLFVSLDPSLLLLLLLRFLLLCLRAVPPTCVLLFLLDHLFLFQLMWS